MLNQVQEASIFNSLCLLLSILNRDQMIVEELWYRSVNSDKQGEMLRHYSSLEGLINIDTNKIIGNGNMTDMSEGIVLIIVRI